MCIAKKKKVGGIMKIYSCQSHIDQALEDFIVEEEKFPIMTEVDQENKLSTNCTYCHQATLYIVSNE